MSSGRQGVCLLRRNGVWKEHTSWGLTIFPLKGQDLYFDVFLIMNFYISLFKYVIKIAFVSINDYFGAP